MRTVLIIITVLMGYVAGYAQSDIETQKAIWKQMVADTLRQHQIDDSLRALPSMIGDYTYGNGYHKGLNVEAGMSAFATFGHGLPHRGGFSQSLTTTWLTPLTKDYRLWLALGSNVSHTNWGSDHYYDGTLNAALGYKFDDRWEAYIYGQLNIANNYIRRHIPYYNRWGYITGDYWPGLNRIGAAVRYNISPSVSIQINAEVNGQ